MASCDLENAVSTYSCCACAIHDDSAYFAHPGGSPRASKMARNRPPRPLELLRVGQFSHHMIPGDVWRITGSIVDSPHGCVPHPMLKRPSTATGTQTPRTAHGCSGGSTPAQSRTRQYVLDAGRSAGTIGSRERPHHVELCTKTGLKMPKFAILTLAY